MPDYCLFRIQRWRSYKKPTNRSIHPDIHKKQAQERLFHIKTDRNFFLYSKIILKIYRSVIKVILLSYIKVVTIFGNFDLKLMLLHTQKVREKFLRNFDKKPEKARNRSFRYKLACNDCTSEGTQTRFLNDRSNFIKKQNNSHDSYNYVHCYHCHYCCQYNYHHHQSWIASPLSSLSTISLNHRHHSPPLSNVTVVMSTFIYHH